MEEISFNVPRDWPSFGSEINFSPALYDIPIRYSKIPALEL